MTRQPYIQPALPAPSPFRMNLITHWRRPSLPRFPTRRPEPSATAASASVGATSSSSSMTRGSNRSAHVTSTGTRRTSSASLPLATVVRAVRVCMRRFVRGTCVECVAADTPESESITGGSASATVCTYVPPLRAARRELRQSQAARHRAHFRCGPLIMCISLSSHISNHLNRVLALVLASSSKASHKFCPTDHRDRPYTSAVHSSTLPPNGAIPLSLALLPLSRRKILITCMHLSS